MRGCPFQSLVPTKNAIAVEMIPEYKALKIIGQLNKTDVCHSPVSKNIVGDVKSVAIQIPIVVNCIGE